MWEDNKLEKVWFKLNDLSKTELAFIIAWMTAIISDDGEVRLSQWLVWMETKSNKS